MSTDTSASPRTPLYDFHRRYGTVAFGDVDGWQMPRVFENIKMEYLAAKGTVAVMDRSNYGRLRVSGAKRLDLLNRLTTNDVKSVAAGQGALTALLTDKGRMIDVLRLSAREDFLWLLTSPGNQTRVMEQIVSMRFRDDVSLEVATPATAMISLFGPQAAHLLGAAARAHHFDDLPEEGCRAMEIGGTQVTAIRTRGLGGAGYDIIADAAGAASVWQRIFAEGVPYGASPMGEEAWEMLRIESGIPRFGRELTEEHNPLEAGLSAAISFKKGCYVGQEVIARLDSRQKVSRQLVGLWIEPGPVPPPSSSIEAPGQQGTPVGTLTSVAPSLDFRRVIGLGYVRNEHAAAGTSLAIVDGGDRYNAVVSDLPFTKPTQPQPGRA